MRNSETVLLMKCSGVFFFSISYNLWILIYIVMYFPHMNIALCKKSTHFALNVRGEIFVTHLSASGYCLKHLISVDRWGKLQVPMDL